MLNLVKILSVFVILQSLILRKGLFMKSSRLLALPLLLGFTNMAHAATTDIDVLFMVSQSTFDTYGHEAVFKSLNQQLDQANTLFNAGVTGLDVQFNVKAIQAYDGVLGETSADCVGHEATKAAGAVEALIKASHYTATSDYMDLNWADLCMTSSEQQVLASAAQAAGADYVVMVDSLTDGNIAATAKPAAAMTVHYPKVKAWTIAHEIGHLLGLVDLYTSSSNDCNGVNRGRLMCGVAPSVATADDAAALFSDEEETVIKGMLNVTDRRPMDVSLINLLDIVGSGAGLAAARDDEGRTVTLSVGNATLTGSAPTATLTVTMNEAATEPVLVTVTSDSDTLTAGAAYLDNVAQVITLEAGETSKTFTLTANDLSTFSGAKAVTVELLGASGAAVSGNPVAVSLTGTASSGGDSGGNGSGGSSGGGSFGWLTLGLLGLVGLKKRK
jgi:hypothetical protein